jgi:F-type H+-transporting ATPase subunit b
MEIHWQDIILHAVNIAILFVGLRMLLYKPINKFLQAREARFEGRISDIEQKEAEAAKHKQEYDTLLSRAHSDAAEIVKHSTDLAKDHAKDVVTKAEDQSREMITRAKKDIENKKLQEKENLKTEITNMAVQIAGKVLQREVTMDDNKKIIDDFFTKVG